MTTLVVLAAGLASRYGSDKQLEAVGPAGELLLEYALHDAWRAGCERAVVIVRDELRSPLETVLAPWGRRLPLAFAVQRPDQPVADAPRARRKPWGTAHALLAARPHVAGDVLVCNADDFYGASAFAGVVSTLRAAAGHAVAGYPLADTLSPHGGVSRAVCVADADARLVRIEEHTGITRDDVAITDDRGRVLPADVPVSMNLWGFRGSFFAHLDDAFHRFVREHGADERAELRIPDVVNERVARGDAVRVVPVRDTWFGMTYAADRPSVRGALAARVAAGEYPADLRA